MPTIRAVEGVNFDGETGLGPWIRERRETLGMTQRQLAAAAGVGDRTLQRYERDVGLGYETLRVLDALGVRLKPEPRSRSAAATNTELRRVSDLLAALQDLVFRSGSATADSLADLAARLERVEKALEPQARRAKAG